MHVLYHATADNFTLMYLTCAALFQHPLAAVHRYILGISSQQLSMLELSPLLTSPVRACFKAQVDLA